MNYKKKEFKKIFEDFQCTLLYLTSLCRIYCIYIYWAGFSAFLFGMPIIVCAIQVIQMSRQLIGGSSQALRYLSDLTCAYQSLQVQNSIQKQRLFLRNLAPFVLLHLSVSSEGWNSLHLVHKFASLEYDGSCKQAPSREDLDFKHFKAGTASSFVLVQCLA